MAEIEFPPGTPEELQEFIRKQVDRHEMSAELHQHAVTRFFDELSEEQSKQMLMLMRIFEEDVTRVTFFLGYLLANIQARFGVCSACGKNHDKQMERIAAAEDVPDHKRLSVLRIALAEDDDE